MTSLDKMLEKEMSRLPRIFFAKMISDKLHEIGAPESEELVDAIIKHIEEGSDDDFFWDYGDDGTDQKYKLVITDEDMSKFEDDLSEFMKNDLRDIIQKTSEDVARVILESLRDKWPDIDQYEKSINSDFRHNLEERWGDAFTSLRMLLSISREIGEETATKFNKSRSKVDRTLKYVLLKLHARACRTAGEIITLFENGYADGAMARWRTLHELVVVASVLVDGGEQLAKRYVDHQIIETKAELDEYQRCYKRLGEKPIPYRERQKIIKEYERVIEKYGKEFSSPYGWATQHLHLKKPILKDLEISASHSHMRTYYKLASQNIHASAKSLFHTLGTYIDGDILMLAGASNAGFHEPALNTAASLVQISSLLDRDRMGTLDHIVRMRAMLILRDDVSRKFVKAAEMLERDHMAMLDNL